MQYLHYGDEFRARVKSCTGWLWCKYKKNLNAFWSLQKNILTTALDITNPTNLIGTGLRLLKVDTRKTEIPDSDGQFVGEGDHVVVYTNTVINGQVARIFLTGTFSTTLETNPANSTLLVVKNRPRVGPEGHFYLYDVNNTKNPPYHLWITEILALHPNSVDAATDLEIAEARSHQVINRVLSAVEIQYLDQDAALRPALLRAFFLENEAALMGLIQAPENEASFLASTTTTPDTAQAPAQQAKTESVVSSKSIAILGAVGVALILFTRV